MTTTQSFIDRHFALLEALQQVVHALHELRDAARAHQCPSLDQPIEDVLGFIRSIREHHSDDEHALWSGISAFLARVDNVLRHPSWRTCGAQVTRLALVVHARASRLHDLRLAAAIVR